MATTVTAIYEDGVLRLLTPLPLPEHTPVEVTVELPSGSSGGGCARSGPGGIDCRGPQSRSNVALCGTTTAFRRGPRSVSTADPGWPAALRDHR
jgi:hypothetical protein